MGYIHPGVSEICDPQSLDPICGKFNKFLAHGQAHMGQMGKWPWQCTTRGLDNSTELRMEKIRQLVITEIWVPQVWQPPGRPPARTVTTIPLQPGGLRGKKVWRGDRQTDRRTKISVLRAAWSQLNMTYHSVIQCASSMTKAHKRRWKLLWSQTVSQSGDSTTSGTPKGCCSGLVEYLKEHRIYIK